MNSDKSLEAAFDGPARAAAAQDLEAAAERAARRLIASAPPAATDAEAHARMSAKPTGADLRRKILDEVAGCVCRDRMNVYGDAEDNFADIAEFHTTYLRARGLLAEGAKIESFDVAAMANLMKIARAANAPTHLDNWVDGAGYAVCGAGIVKRKLECA